MNKYLVVILVDGLIITLVNKKDNRYNYIRFRYPKSNKDIKKQRSVNYYIFKIL
jgi:hypothetical protein